ncbi:hypothetical protein BFL28_13960 [Sphingomonas turrisvirgatae]|uniref:Uncharacterized protein n=1 Tax=Sphingomonas turrisvirgatae TaxID=1888892 RepID=A0A1E3LZE3_9SPHN|nr:hypothetical protein BFL28_13960 [Sphingomonas turrisvirgatae]
MSALQPHPRTANRQLTTHLKPFRSTGFDPIADIGPFSSYQLEMRKLTPLLLLMGWSCTRIENTFVVHDEAKLVASATLTLCGDDTPLRRSGDRFGGSRVIDCEGSGSIRLRYASGREYNCIVGYVTPGSVQNFTFRPTRTGCA